jgi:hypothetical protein
MDLLSLIAACAGGFPPPVLQALVVVESQAEPWSFRIEGDPESYAFADPDAALRMARKLQQLGHRIRIGYAGIQADMPGVSSPATSAMFMPCVNIHLASRALVALEERCRLDETGKRDPLACALSLYQVGQGAPDRAFADEVLLQASLGPHQLPAVDLVPVTLVPGSTVDGMAAEGGGEPLPDPEVQQYLNAGGPLTPAQAAGQGIAAEGDRQLFVHQRAAGAAPTAATTFVRNGKPADGVSRPAPAAASNPPAQ